MRSFSKVYSIVLSLVLVSIFVLPAKSQEEEPELMLYKQYDIPIKEYKNAVFRCSPNDKYILIYYTNEEKKDSIAVFDASNGKFIRKLKRGEACYGELNLRQIGCDTKHDMHKFADDNTVFTINPDRRSIGIYDFEKSEKIRDFKQDTGVILGFDVTNDGRYLACSIQVENPNDSCFINRIAIWDLQEDKSVLKVKLKKTGLLEYFGEDISHRAGLFDPEFLHRNGEERLTCLSLLFSKWERKGMGYVEYNFFYDEIAYKNQASLITLDHKSYVERYYQTDYGFTGKYSLSGNYFLKYGKTKDFRYFICKPIFDTPKNKEKFLRFNDTLNISDDTRIFELSPDDRFIFLSNFRGGNELYAFLKDNNYYLDETIYSGLGFKNFVHAPMGNFFYTRDSNTLRKYTYSLKSSVRDNSKNNFLSMANPINSNKIELNVNVSSNVQVYIMDMLGSYSERVIDSYFEHGKYDIALPLGDKPSGVYLIKLRDSSGERVYKLVKE